MLNQSRVTEPGTATELKLPQVNYKAITLLLLAVIAIVVTTGAGFYVGSSARVTTTATETSVTTSSISLTTTSTNTLTQVNYLTNTITQATTPYNPYNYGNGNYGGYNYGNGNQCYNGQYYSSTPCYPYQNYQGCGYYGCVTTPYQNQQCVPYQYGSYYQGLICVTGYLQPYQQQNSNCMYLEGTDGQWYNLINFQTYYPTGKITVQGYIINYGSACTGTSISVSNAYTSP